MSRVKARTVCVIRDRYAAGDSIADLAQDYNLNVERVRRIVWRKTYRNAECQPFWDRSVKP